MLKALPFAALLAGAALLLDAAPAQAQVTINIGRPAPPPPVVVVREARPAKHWKHRRHYYQPRPVMLVPAQPVYYAPRGYGHGSKHGHGRGHGHGRH
ncbi:hypothetical protein K3G63_14795 [Hymenobacter sp. HSC-4F20]|uniref:hypothetical protein n=1 Tax=Hymenobacter sp. HSC-4F20 TaxID=2864135 RepID=UPI001C72F1D0|nr:hypothetical protein [Hymenobacter sp. HSC-4F20]MBX0291716.1 hypothetical protein [Hymenobacter sp. HSC-4F20]